MRGMTRYDGMTSNDSFVLSRPLTTTFKTIAFLDLCADLGFDQDKSVSRDQGLERGRREDNHFSEATR